LKKDESRRVFIVLGLYRPDPILLARQLASLEAQSFRNVQLVLAADGPLDEETRSLVSRHNALPVSLSESPVRAGVHANFARGLRIALSLSRGDGDLFAFCDQDDVWLPEKLARQVAVFDDPRTSLCHCDARIVARDGEVIAASMFAREARVPDATLADLLVMNSVTGMTALIRRDIAVAAQSFPLADCRYVLHDYWVALVASLFDRIQFIAEPLVDYTQHPDNVRGATLWLRSGQRRVPMSRTCAYLRKAYREFLWRRRVLEALRREFAQVPRANARLYDELPERIFDCGKSSWPLLAANLALRVRGQPRQADQLWRLVLGKMLFCGRRSRRRPIQPAAKRDSAAASVSAEA
jgi:glycosyltransferase involved in cell wall biosynthesis